MQPDHLRLIYYITLLTKPITLPKAVEYMLNGHYLIALGDIYKELGK